MGFALALFGMIMFAASNVTVKIASGKLEVNLGVLISAVANIVFGALLFGIQVLRFGCPPGVDIRAVLLFVVSGVFSTYLGRLFSFATIAKIGPAKASAFQITNPLFTFLVAFLFLGEKLKPIHLPAIAATLVGLFFVSYVPGAWANADRFAGAALPAGPGLGGTLRRGGIVLSQSGVLLALSSAASYAVANVLRGAAIRSWNEPVLGGIISAFAGMFAQAALMPKTRASLWKLPSVSRSGLLLWGLIGTMTICAQISVIAAMRTIPVGVANLITMSTPIVVTPASYFLLRNQEGITGKTVLGIALVLGGISVIVLK